MTQSIPHNASDNVDHNRPHDNCDDQRPRYTIPDAALVLLLLQDPLVVELLYATALLPAVPERQ